MNARDRKHKPAAANSASKHHNGSASGIKGEDAEGHSNHGNENSDGAEEDEEEFELAN